MHFSAMRQLLLCRDVNVGNAHTSDIVYCNSTENNYAKFLPHIHYSIKFCLMSSTRRMVFSLRPKCKQCHER